MQLKEINDNLEYKINKNIKQTEKIMFDIEKKMI